MKRILLFLLLLPALALTAPAQQTPEAKIKKEISDAASRIRTMQCSFVQTKHVKMLNDRLVSKGQMHFRAGDRLRWAYTSPYQYTFVLNGDKVKLSKGKRSDVINTAGNKLFREIARIMMNSVVGKCLTDDKDFSSRVSATSTEYVATLTPRRKELKSMFSLITLRFDRKRAMVTSVELSEKNGDKTVIRLENVKTNTPLSDALFKID